MLKPKKQFKNLVESLELLVEDCDCRSQDALDADPPRETASEKWEERSQLAQQAADELQDALDGWNDPV